MLASDCRSIIERVPSDVWSVIVEWLEVFDLEAVGHASRGLRRSTVATPAVWLSLIRRDLGVEDAARTIALLGWSLQQHQRRQRGPADATTALSFMSTAAGRQGIAPRGQPLPVGIPHLSRGSGECSWRVAYLRLLALTGTIGAATAASFVDAESTLAVLERLRRIGTHQSRASSSSSPVGGWFVISGCVEAVRFAAMDGVLCVQCALQPTLFNVSANVTTLITALRRRSVSGDRERRGRFRFDPRFYHLERAAVVEVWDPAVAVLAAHARAQSKFSRGFSLTLGFGFGWLIFCKTPVAAAVECIAAWAAKATLTYFDVVHVAFGLGDSLAVSGFGSPSRNVPEVRSCVAAVVGPIATTTTLLGPYSAAAHAVMVAAAVTYAAVGGWRSGRQHPRAVRLFAGVTSAFLIGLAPAVAEVFMATYVLTSPWAVSVARFALRGLLVAWLPIVSAVLLFTLHRWLLRAVKAACVNGTFSPQTRQRLDKQHRSLSRMRYPALAGAALVALGVNVAVAAARAMLTSSWSTAENTVLSTPGAWADATEEAAARCAGIGVLIAAQVLTAPRSGNGQAWARRDSLLLKPRYVDAFAPNGSSASVQPIGADAYTDFTAFTGAAIPDRRPRLHAVLAAIVPAYLHICCCFCSSDVSRTKIALSAAIGTAVLAIARHCGRVDAYRYRERQHGSQGCMP